MEAHKKAAQIKEHFKVQNGDLTNKQLVITTRAYIGQLMNDIPMLSGDFEMAYEHEWWQYTSYWYSVLKFL